MATTDKKKAMQSSMGRPPTGGALSTFPRVLQDLIKEIRADNPGFGAISILLELEEEHQYTAKQLPSAKSIQTFLKLSGFILPKEPRFPLPVKKKKLPKNCHDKWELDAKGTVFITGIGYQALINIKDVVSRKYCMAFPVSVKNKNTQPRTIHYKWALRMAFMESGLPKAIQVDKDSVFIENSSKSPFPSRLHLWLLALGIELEFITKPPPAMNSIVERSHQTIFNQAVKGKNYNYWGAFFKNLNKKRKRLNEKYPSRTFGKKAPLQVHPQAVHSGRNYDIEQEEDLLNMKKIYAYLAKGEWYRKVSSSKGIYLGAKRYVLKNAIPKTSVHITFNNRCKKLIFHDVKEQEIGRCSIKELSKKELMELSQALLVVCYKQLLKAKHFPI